jgi:8-oxo-dGTP diphosphatase
MTLLVVRHADAGDRMAWRGDDRDRPLTARGEAQAAALVGLHAERPVTRVLTSPYRRCVQTVEPLASARGVEVEEVDALAEGAPFDLVDRLLGAAADGGGAVLCSHGDVIGAIVTALGHRGLSRSGEGWPKGSTWVIEGWPDPDAATFVPRPAVG